MRRALTNLGARAATTARRAASFIGGTSSPSPPNIVRRIINRIRGR
ncbi:hypothetical protein [Actinobaculum sp. 352]|nr:hypothetical protein [Actinobaculum sp. 352]